MNEKHKNLIRINLSTAGKAYEAGLQALQIKSKMKNNQILNMIEVLKYSHAVYDQQYNHKTSSNKAINCNLF